ncbi:EAL domain-containing protein [Halalkalibacter krulwichiae]|uniref:Blue light-and temperature-regulated antirepressor YcgF n=1 Tax=Halalkalibacter krulwichiae TaxID=199441 RepID=A0A1X9MCW5_9BACI|nr:EAL domain-containing protein [Halalkalibacter krulwichiae]ARK31275.1 Blue light- and temperature-regulated antirepressor YcgF [Halalkalibacter krulwichiae]
MLYKSKESRVETLKESIYHQFQTLWVLDNRSVYGYEAFLRHTSNMNPEELFQFARDENQLYEFDTLSILKAIEEFSVVSDSKLFLNVYPSTVINKDFPRLINSIIKKYPLVVNYLVLELNETSLENEIWSEPQLKERINWLKKLGLCIAIDDVGKGAASLQQIIEYKPQYIKLDRYFSIELGRTLEKQQMISSIVNYCKSFEVKLILEGIETHVDLSIAKALNIDIGQGFVLGKPQLLNSIHK